MVSRYEPGTVYNCPSHALRLYRAGNLLCCPVAKHLPGRPQEAQAVVCPRCEMISFHPDDIREGYCGNCHDWTGTAT